jgi:hypothetical protein
MRLIKWILKSIKPQAATLGAFWFLDPKNFEFQKMSAGAAMTHEFISPTPADAPSSHRARKT